MIPNIPAPYGQYVNNGHEDVDENEKYEITRNGGDGTIWLLRTIVHAILYLFRGIHSIVHSPIRQNCSPEFWIPHYDSIFLYRIQCPLDIRLETQTQ